MVKTYYTQAELRQYLESQLGVEAVPAGLGVYYVFKDEALREQVLAQRYRYRPAEPKKLLSELSFEENRELLEPFYARLLELGRVPEPDEYADYEAVAAKFGSVRRAFALIRRVTRLPNWAEIRQQRADDLLVYFALSRFRKRPPLKKLPATLRRDIKEFLGTYKRACERADALLFKAGESEEAASGVAVYGRGRGDRRGLLQVEAGEALAQCALCAPLGAGPAGADPAGV